jgi:hypothetical protein
MGRVLMKVAGLTLGWLALAACAAAHATDWDLDLDVRLLTSDGHRSFLDGGLGSLRFGEDKSGVQLGRARLALTHPIGEVLTLRLDASAWDDDDKNPIDLTEAYLEYRPYPRAGLRARVKAGAFYAPISLENRAAGWESPYTISSSALNTWIAEELRTIGLETQIEWLGTRTGHNFDVELTAAVFGWNDPAGGVVASHGFGLHDRQTTLFGRVGPRGVPPLYGRELFHEIDGRAGIYAGIEARYLDRVVLRALHYDNRGDPAAYDPGLMDFAWKTRFDSAGLRLEGSSGWTAILQWLAGETYIDPGWTIEWPFDARFALLSKRAGSHMLSVRYDDFSVSSNLPSGDGVQNGHAWTAAYVFEHDPHWRFTLEWLRVSSRASTRPIYLSEQSLATETQVQLAVRYAMGSTVH